MTETNKTQEDTETRKGIMLEKGELMEIVKSYLFAEKAWETGGVMETAEDFREHQQNFHVMQLVRAIIAEAVEPVDTKIEDAYINSMNDLRGISNKYANQLSDIAILEAKAESDVFNEYSNQVVEETIAENAERGKEVARKNKTRWKQVLRQRKLKGE